MELDKRIILKSLRIGGVILILLIILFKLVFNLYNPQISSSYKQLLPLFFRNKIKLLQEKIIDNFNFLLSEPELSVVKSLLFGEKNNLPFSIKKLIQKSGLSHLFAVSGLHLAITIQIFLYFFNFLPLPRFLKFSFLILIILSYVVMADFSASILRSAFMNLIMIFAFLNYRQYQSFRSLVITILILALVNPLIIFKDIGFQLSVLATMGIICLYPLFAQSRAEENNLIKQNVFSKLLLSIFDYFKMCLAAIIFTFPLIIYYFHEFSLITPLTNILTVPMMPVIFILSLITVFLSFIFNSLALVSSWFLKLLIDYFLMVIKIFGNLNVFRIFIPHLFIILVLIYYFILFVLLFIKNKKLTPSFYEK
ncbi:MAG: ComEC/Rec2 family competence protein [Minisyncoccia bacterium]